MLGRWATAIDYERLRRSIGSADQKRQEDVKALLAYAEQLRFLLDKTAAAGLAQSEWLKSHNEATERRFKALEERITDLEWRIDHGA